MNKIPHVTVGVCALNEESNIGTFLDSVLLQTEESFILDTIVVYSDGSTDRTVDIVKEYMERDARIILRAYRKRVGKSSRLNHLYAHLKSDILVQSDADVIFSHPFVIRDIISPLRKNDDIAMAGGRPMPVPATTFIESAVNCTFSAYDPLRGTLRGGNNIFSVDGRLLAYKKSLVKTIHIPEDMIANDAYTYFVCLNQGYLYRYVSSAVVWYRSPQTVRDQIKQNTRFVSSPKKISDYIDPQLVSKEFYVPRMMLLGLQFGVFIKHPFLCMVIYIINIFCKIKSRFDSNNQTAIWAMATSTKHIHETK